MACLSTSGRVACGSRSHKLICRLFLNHSPHSRQSSSQLLTGDTTAGHPREYRATTPNQQLARSFHGLTLGINQDYLSLLVSRKSGGNDINCNTQRPHTRWPPTRLAGI